MKIVFALEQNFECCPLSRVTYPTYVRSLLLEGFILISLAFAGHSSDKTDFVAVLLAQAIAHITLYATQKVLNEVLDQVLHSEMLSYGVNKLITVHAMKYLAVSWTVSLGVAIIWLNAGNLSLLCFQDAIVSQKVNTYLLIYISILPVYPILTGCLTLLDAIGSSQMFTNLVLIIGNCVQIILSYVLCNRVGLGVEGMAVGPAVSYYMVVIPILCYLMCKRFTCQVFYTLSLQWLNDWTKYVTVGFPRWVRICAEYFLFHAGLFIVGTPGAGRYTEIGVYGILLYLNRVLSIWGESVSGGVCVRLKRLLQNRFYLEVQNALISSVLWSLTTALIQSLFMVALSQWVGWIFSRDVVTVTAAGELVYLAAIVAFCKCTQECFRGQMRGWGMDKNGWGLAILSFIIGLTLSILLSKLWLSGALGYWVGLVARAVFIIAWVLVASIRRYKKWFKEIEIPPLPIMSPSIAATDRDPDRVVTGSYDRDSTVFKSIRVESNAGSFETTPDLSPGSSLASSLETGEMMRLVPPSLDTAMRPPNLKWILFKRLALVSTLVVLLVAMSVCRSIDYKLVVNVSTNFSAAVSFCCVSFKPYVLR